MAFKEDGRQILSRHAGETRNSSLLHNTKTQGGFHKKESK